MDYYNILGVKKTASQEEIKDAYKKLIKKYHPDIYVGDKAFAQKKTSEINVAYDVLSNPEAKQEYDDSISPQYTYTSPKYEYTPPKYNNYNTNYGNTSNYNTYRNKYYNSQSNYTGPKDGSERDYSTYVNYERKYTNYHRSTTANSNYTVYSDPEGFSDKVEKKFYDLSPRNKVLVSLLVLLFYFVVVVIFLLQFLQTFNSNTNKLAQKNKNTLKDTTTSYYNSHSSSSTDSSTNSVIPKDSILRNYFTETQLKDLYNQYLENLQENPETQENDDLYLSFSEFIKMLEKYMTDVLNSNTIN